MPDWLAGDEHRTRLAAVADSLPDPAEPAVTVFSVDELFRRERPKWLVRGVLPLVGLGCIYAQPGAGKTFLALDQALAVARGVDWFGRRTKAGVVVYVATEGALRLRVEAYCVAHGLEPADLENFGVIEQSINLLSHDPRELAELQGAIEAFAAGRPIREIVIDTLNRAMPGGDENGPADMGLAIASATELQRRFECFVQLVHHAGKDESRGMRGHSSLRGATDSELSIVREGDLRLVKIEKNKEGSDYEKFAAFQLRFHDLGAVSDDDPEADDDERYSSCSVEPAEVEDFEAQPKLSPQQAAMMRFIHKTFDRTRTRPPASLARHPDPPITGQNVLVRADLFETIDLGGGISSTDQPDSERRIREKVLKRLQALDFIRVQEEYLWLATNRRTSPDQ